MSTAIPTLEAVTSDLGGAAIIAIVLGSLAALSLLAVLVVCCCRQADSEKDEYEDADDFYHVDSAMLVVNQAGTKNRHGFKSP